MLNKVQIIGNLGADPEVKYSQAGTAVCNFNLACNEKWTDKDGNKQEHTEWVRVVVWGKQAEHCGKYLAKGRQAYVEGKLKTRDWQDKDGNKRYTTEVVAQSVLFLSGGDSSSSNRQQAPRQKPDTAQFNQSFSDDDIPF